MLKVTYVGGAHEGWKNFLRKIATASKEFPYVIHEEAGGDGVIMSTMDIIIDEVEAGEILRAYQELGPNETKTLRVGPEGEDIRFIVCQPF